MPDERSDFERDERFRRMEREEQANPFYREIQAQLGTLMNEVQELRETIEGDPRGRYLGLSKEVEKLKRLVNSYEQEEQFRKQSEEKRDKRSRFFVALLSTLAVIISILVGLNSLITSFGG